MKHAKRGLKVFIFRFVCAYGKIESDGWDEWIWKSAEL